ncbi:MAG TPA: hypothetical protein PLS90_01090 [Candidatus Sumerlaeota bacterium]|nr:hypothetical protein [Candidatus Sumerlaeota bacterium]HOR28666.1 hypothetical protein [Candidatus Sumerlaeota bacterium]HPK01026.1 hypothetical protein [Candidatus Sumerlaeota bacterium]
MALPPSGTLVICRPFAPCATPALPAGLHFALTTAAQGRNERFSLREAAESFERAVVEQSLGEELAEAGVRLQLAAIPDFVRRVEPRGAHPRLLILVSNDTHARFMIPAAEGLGDVLFLIPPRGLRDEGAAETLQSEGFAFVELTPGVEELVRAFGPRLMLCGNDWSEEFQHARRLCRRLGIPSVALQEGPQDWEAEWGGRNPRKYLNADIVLAQGAVTLRHIRPRCFAVTGNPKVDRFEPIALPERPRILINCNFTYGQYEEARALWMHDVLGACRELGLDYFISQHPRDPSSWEGEPVVRSAAERLAAQIAEASLVVTRFSNLPYEALAAGRPVIYYNPHGEPMKTFREDRCASLGYATRPGQLRRLLRRHQLRPEMDREGTLAFLRRHCGSMRGRAQENLVSLLRAIPQGAAEAGRIRL